MVRCGGFMMGDCPRSRLKISRDLSASLTALLKGFSGVPELELFFSLGRAGVSGWLT